MDAPMVRPKSGMAENKKARHPRLRERASGLVLATPNHPPVWEPIIRSALPANFMVEQIYTASKRLPNFGPQLLAEMPKKHETLRGISSEGS